MKSTKLLLLSCSARFYLCVCVCASHFVFPFLSCRHSLCRVYVLLFRKAHSSCVCLLHILHLRIFYSSFCSYYNFYLFHWQICSLLLRSSKVLNFILLHFYSSQFSPIHKFSIKYCNVFNSSWFSLFCFCSLSQHLLFHNISTSSHYFPFFYS